MKIARPITLTTIALMALSLGVVGCKTKNPRTTTLSESGQGRTGIAGDRSSLIGNGGTLNSGNAIAADPTPVKPSDIGANETGTPQTSRDFSSWNADPEAFKDQTVYFDYDKANVKPSEIEKLKEVARRMKSSFQGKALRIEGHCDERGTEEYNRTLGDRRAQSIRELLVSEGLDPSLMPTLTFGEDKPVDLGHNEAAYSHNRRGALVLLSPPSDAGAHLTTGLGETKAPPQNSE